MRSLGKNLLIIRPVVANCTGANQPARRLVYRTKPFNQLPSKIDTARDNVSFIGSTPASVRQPRTCQVDNCVNGFNAVLQSSHESRLIGRRTLPPRQHSHVMTILMQRGACGLTDQPGAASHQDMHAIINLLSRVNPGVSEYVYAL